MSKSIATYWNPLVSEMASSWESVKELEGMAEEVMLNIDSKTGEYTWLTRFFAGADTSPFGGKSYSYPEEVFFPNKKI